MQHFVQCDAIIRGKRISYWIERDPDRMGFRNTVQDIADGQIENVREVLALTSRIRLSMT